MKYVVTIEEGAKIVAQNEYYNAYMAADAVSAASIVRRIDHTSLLESRLLRDGYCDAHTPDGGVVFCTAEVV